MELNLGHYIYYFKTEKMYMFEVDLYSHLPSLCPDVTGIWSKAKSS